jgi:hypothetical protein
MIFFMFYRRDFVKNLVASVQQTPAEASVPGRRSRPGTEVERRLTARHFPSKVIPKPGVKRERPLRKCVVCNPAEKELRIANHLPSVTRPGRESRYECSKCGVGLCVEPCFMLYHRYSHYILAYKRMQKNELTDDDDDDDDDAGHHEQEQ